ncbi:hypothetical protein M1771_05620 [Spiroplasma citri]|uniref:Uncharacterized protein n=1 Tax=Spiroplasma citri TaxID=2133 RepID=A0AAX3SW95_SPICI|nr:hypothetical protein [Spiroplasma citri]WFG95581.1 hypothetical protein M0C40_05655 [Spiroplasma citri]WFG97530.1 hypothetical protein M1770_05590 [Spiroplasma citri]WFG99469.1 hypothetical protein M1771_05620 [Spiroplasma citri]
MKKYVAKKDIDNYLDKKLEEAKFKTRQTDIDTIWEKSDEDIKKAIDEVVNNPLWNQLFKNLSKM